MSISSGVAFPSTEKKKTEQTQTYEYKLEIIICPYWQISGKRVGVMVSELDSGSSGPGSRPG